MAKMRIILKNSVNMYSFLQPARNRGYFLHNFKNCVRRSAFAAVTFRSKNRSHHAMPA